MGNCSWDLCHTQGLRARDAWFRAPQKRTVRYKAPMGGKRLPGPRETWDPAVYAELDLRIAPERWKGMGKGAEAITWASLSAEHVSGICPSG